MKRILNYILIPLALLVLSACVHDEKELFDESASVRISKALEEDAAILESATNGWELHYYTGKEYRYAGYTYLIKFFPLRRTESLRSSRLMFHEFCI